MEKKDISAVADIIGKNTIFGSLRKSGAEALAGKMQINEYSKGQAIRSGKANPGGICFILSGTASVVKGKIVINTLREGDTFGAADLYRSGKSTLTDIIAVSECRIAVLPKAEIDSMIASSPAFAKSYVAYLSDRIAFLTGRIETVTGGSAVNNLKAYIISADGCIDARNMSLLAKKLDMSRATLYRAVASLESDGMIERNGDKIILIK